MQPGVGFSQKGTLRVGMRFFKGRVRVLFGSKLSTGEPYKPSTLEAPNPKSSKHEVALQTSNPHNLQ